MRDKLILIDGHALVFKMYYAFAQRPMINSKGMDTSILFGFTKYLLEMLEKEKPSHVAVAFDPPGGTFRNQLYPGYKANRPPTPQLVIDALEPLTAIVKAMNIPVLMVPGFEADDVIGTMARRSEAEGFDVFMVTPDKDYGQLISDHVFQLKPGKAGSENELIDKSRLCEKYGITDPLQIIDMLAICGDTADNVPGVKGVGEVGAGKLITRYGNLENIYAHLDELTRSQREKFEAARDHIDLSKVLVKIRTDVPLDTTAGDMRLNMSFNPSIADLFELYEFRSLRRYISHVPSDVQPETDFAFKEVSPREVVEAARRTGCISLVIEPVTHNVFSGISRIFAASGKEDALVAAEGTPADFTPAIEDAAISTCGYDLKFQSELLKAQGITMNGRQYDIELMHYLLDPEKSHKADTLAMSYLGISLEQPRDNDALPVMGSLFDEIPDEEPRQSRTREAAALLAISARVRAQLDGKSLTRLYDTMEEPLSRVLAKMELAGVKVDMAQLNTYAEELRREISEREARIREIAGDPSLNVSSPKQIGELLFDRLALDPRAKKTGRGQYTTDETTLQALYDRHPVIDEILEFRAAKKLLSTYIEPFPTYISPVDGRIHTTFNQALTATGRLSSSAPNLQNIPIRTDRGREIRKAFIPGSPANLIMSADYSQIELRIMAHLSQDQHLITAFREGVDVHSATASKIFGIPHADVTPDQRRIAKTANFGIMYGISAFGLAQRLKMGRGEAQKLIDDYFASFPAIRSFINDNVAFAKANGYVETLFGRRRYLPDINANNATARALAERNAVNAPIQGTAADIIKLAMIKVDEAMTAAGLKSRMVLQIHDELVFDVEAGEVDTLRDIVVNNMEQVMTLTVPLTVECNTGKNWLEAH